MNQLKSINEKLEVAKRLQNCVEDLMLEMGKLLNDLCEFPAKVDYCAGDGFLITNEDTLAQAGFDCLKGISTNNKLTAKDHSRAGF